MSLPPDSSPVFTARAPTCSGPRTAFSSWIFIGLFVAVSATGSSAIAGEGRDDGATVPLAQTRDTAVVTASNNDQGPQAAQWSKIYPKNTLIVGAVMNGVEVGSLEVVRDGDRFLIPLKAFTELSGSDLDDADGAVRMVTPLGAVELTPDDLVEILGITYLKQEAVESKLATPIEFDSMEFALVFDLPWWREAGQRPELETVAVAPDATPPAASVSTLRSDIFFTDVSDRSFFSTSTVADGRLAGGRWRIRYLDDLAGAHNLREYAWLRTFGHNLVLVGQQRLDLHPVLESFELTGYQQAWTNQPLDLYYISPEPRELLPRRLRPVSTFRGPGPPGGFAELRIDGILVARQPIGLDGVYEFLDVPISTRQLSTIEVYVFDRHNPTVPVAIHEQRQRTSEFILGKGAVVHMGGVGRSGNLLQELIGETLESEFAGFYQWRYGATQNLTVEAAVQQNAGRRQAMAGFVARLFSDTILSLGVGVSNQRAWSYDLTLEHYRGRNRILGRSQIFRPGYRSAGSEKTYDHYLEVGVTPDRKLDVSLIGRSRRDGSTSTEYVLPALAWWPTSRMSLRARPDSLGDYRFDLFYRLARRARITISHHDRTFTDLSLTTSHRTRLSVGAEHGGDLADRYQATASWDGAGRRQPSLSASLIWSNTEPGYRLSGQAALLPGILGQIDLQDDPVTIDTLGHRTKRLVVGVNIDLAFARGRVVPTSSFSQRGDRGGVAGRVVIDAPRGFPSYRLDDLVILINGQPAGRTTFGGSFFIGNLQPGTYRVSLDTENLPIELVPTDATVIVEVAATAVTGVDFSVRPEFGIAGRLTDIASRQVAGASLEVYDGHGSRVAMAQTDRFGLYRIDGLPVGRYTVRVAENSFPDRSGPLPSLELEITDDFLFGQDLRLSFAVEPVD